MFEKNTGEYQHYYIMICNLRRIHKLSFFHNPGGGEFIGEELYQGRCQVPLMNAKEDYEILIDNLKKSGRVYFTLGENMFESKKLNDDGLCKAGMIRDAFKGLLNKLEFTCPEGREFSIVKTKLEEACFFAIKSVSLNPENQIEET
jgi:hypothetical protein